MAHERYPLTMHHPHHAPATPSRYTEPRLDEWGKKIFGSEQFVQGMPDRLPPVVVLDEDQEEQHRAKGYTAAGHSDPAAFERAKAAPIPVGHDLKEWPKWVNGVECSGPDQAKALEAERLKREYPKWIDGSLVNSPEEEDLLPSVQTRKAEATAKLEVEERALLAELMAKYGSSTAPVPQGPVMTHKARR